MVNEGNDGLINTSSEAEQNEPVHAHVSGIVIPAEFTAFSTNDPHGSVGDMACDERFLYVKTKRGWKRVALDTF